MPLCCCAGIPTALSLYRSGSHRGPACAFLIAVPWFNWYGLTALVIFLGWRAGVIVSLSAVAVGFIAGMLVDTVAGHSPRVLAAPALPVAGGCADTGCCVTSADSAHQPLLDLSNPGEKMRSGARFAVDLVRELGPWMIAGILLGAAIEAIVPKGLVTTYLGKASLVGILMTLVIAGAFYTDSLASLPWVRTLSTLPVRRLRGSDPLRSASWPRRGLTSPTRTVRLWIAIGGSRSMPSLRCATKRTKHVRYSPEPRINCIGALLIPPQRQGQRTNNSLCTA